MNVKTNIGQSFLNLVKKHFSPGSVLHKIFNRNTLKISYCCMNNFQQTINSHNQALLKKNAKALVNKDSCNCRNKDLCPVPEKCNTPSPVVYQATVSTAERIETYVGLAESFKPRYHNHIKSFNNRRYAHDTALSIYIWHLKDNNTPYTINWKFLKKASVYNVSTKRCNLCLWEKYFIICEPHSATLNSRSELVSTCRHSNKFSLTRYTK